MGGFLYGLNRRERMRQNLASRLSVLTEQNWVGKYVHLIDSNYASDMIEQIDNSNAPRSRSSNLGVRTSTVCVSRSLRRTQTGDLMLDMQFSQTDDWSKKSPTGFAQWHTLADDEGRGA